MDKRYKLVFQVMEDCEEIKPIFNPISFTVGNKDGEPVAPGDDIMTAAFSSCVAVASVLSQAIYYDVYGKSEKTQDTWLKDITEFQEQGKELEVA